MKNLTLLLSILLVFDFQNIPAQLNATISPNNPTCANNNGSATANSTGGTNYTYKWNTGATSQTISTLAAGTYTVTVYSSTNGESDTVYFQNFEGAHGWTLNTSTGANGNYPNFWIVSDDEGGVAPPGCGVASNGDKTMHISTTLVVGGGATYFAGGLCGSSICVETNSAATSPSINTTGASNMNFSFDFIGNGDALIDNASLLYSVNSGGNFVSLDSSLKSSVCGGGQGQWASRSYSLPVSCNNITGLQLRFNWTNNDDGVGIDPSVAINNVLITKPGTPASVDSVVRTVTLTLPPSPTINTANVITTNPQCGQNNGSITGISVNGGATPYTIAWTLNGNVVGNSFPLTNVGAGTYIFEVTDANLCVSMSSFTLTPSGTNPVFIITSDSIFCSGDSIQVCATSGFVTYNWSDATHGGCTYPLASGTFSVTAIDNNGCSAASNTINFIIHSLPDASVTTSGNTLSAAAGLNYQWYRNDSLLAGAINQQYIATQSGIYMVVVTDGNGCSATSLAKPIFVSGLNELVENETAKIYPNPNSSGSLRIESNKNLVGEELKIFDVDGKLLVRKVITTTNEKLSVADFRSGIYFIKIGSAIRKLVIE